MRRTPKPQQTGPGSHRRHRRRFHPRRSAALLVALSVALLASALPLSPAEAAFACTITWDGGAGTSDWHHSLNWTGDRLPGANDVVCIHASTAGQAVVMSAPVLTQIGALQTDNELIIEGGELQTTWESYTGATQIEAGALVLGGELRTYEFTQLGGVVEGAGTLAVSGFLRWEGGQQWGPGRTTISAGSAGLGGLLLETAGNRRALGRPIDANAGMVIHDGSFALDGETSVLTLNAPSGPTGNGGKITGNGRVEVNSKLLVEDSILDIDPQLDTTPTASVEVRGADAVLATYGGGQHRGDFVMADGGSFQLRGGVYDFNEGSAIDGASDGNLQIAEQTTDAAVVGRANVADLDVLAGSLQLAGTGNELGNVNLLGGKLRIDEDATAAQLDQDGGSLIGDGSLTVEGDFGWGAGNQEGAGETAVLGTTTVSEGDAGRTLADRLVDSASFSWTETGKLTLSGDANLLMSESTFADGIEAEILGSGTVVPGATEVEASRLQILPHLQIEPGEHFAVTGDDTFLDLQGGATIDGVLEAPEGTHVNFGGDVTVGSDGRLALAHADVGTYPTADVTLGGEINMKSLNVSGTVRVETLLNAGPVVNHGIIEVAPGKTVWTNDFVQNEDEAELTLEGGESTLLMADDGQATLEKGVISGSGKVDGNLVNVGGIVEPTGVLDVTQNYQQLQDGTLYVETDGNAVDQLAVGGAANLDGTLEVVIGGDPATQPLEPLTGAIVTGEFGFVTGPASCWDTEYHPTSVYLIPQPCVIIGAGSGVEDLGVASFPVVLSTPHDAPVVVTYAAQNDTAVVGEDFETTSGSITLQPGQTEGVITVNLVGDDDDEPDETFGLAVSAAGGRLSVDRVVGTIIDDDDEEPRAELDYSVEDIPVRGEWSEIEATSRKYIVGTTDFDHFGTKFSWYYNLSTGTFSYWDDVVWATDLNENNEMVGSCGEPVLDEHLCFRSGKTNFDVGAPDGFSGGPEGLNDAAQMVGSMTDQSNPDAPSSAAIWTPDTLDDPDSIGGPNGATDSSAIDISDTGVIVGESTMPTGRQAWVWTEATGFTMIPSLPGMPYSRPSDINDHGMVVGTGTDGLLTASQTHAWSWTKKGGLVDLGAGAAIGTNADDDIVGVAGGHGVLWRDGELHQLDATLPEGSPWRIVAANTINDNGVIGAMAYDGDYLAPVALKAPEPPCTICISAKTEQKQYPTGEWVAGDGEVVEGTPMRVTGTFKNEGVDPQTVLVTVEDDNGDPVGEESNPITIPAGGSKEVTVDWDTDGMAWANGQPAGPQFVEFNAYDANGEPLDNIAIGTEFVPKPVVLVHGLWSDASTWSSYQQFLASKHPGWKAFAVDTMDTSSFTPNLISENANLVDTYIRQVQEAQNAWQVDLVGHSMGGLVSRFYIQEYMTQLNGQNAVAHLVMLGTPNGGSPCAELAIVPATYELRPDVQAEFNAHITDRKGVPFSLAAGLDMPMTCHMPFPGDDVVPVESAQLGMEDTQLFEVAHTEMTGSKMLFDQWVAPHLLPDGSSSIAAAARASAPDPTELAALAPTDATQLLAAQNLSIDAGGTREIDLATEEGLSELGALALAPGTVEVQLDHGGTIVATSGTGEGPELGFRTATVTDPADGQWTLTLVNHGAANVDVSVSAWAEGLEGTFSTQAAQVGTGGTAQVTATIAGRQFAEIPQVTAEVTDSRGNVHAADLFDDGAHGDGAANDLQYAGPATGLGSGGHLVVARASGLHFSRVAVGSVALTVEGDTPGVNDAPVAFGQSLTVGRATMSQLTLQGVDVDGDPLQYEVKDLPQHGVVQQDGVTSSIRYKPVNSYMGPDSFTFRTFDGVLYSAPVTVAITVDKAPTITEYSGPWPSTSAAGTTVQFQARVIGPIGDFPTGATVDFTLAGTKVSAVVNSAGYARADMTLPLTGGTYPLTMEFLGNAANAPSSATQSIIVVGGSAPTPNFILPVDGEAGYTVRFHANANDVDGNASTYQFDFEDNGSWDATIDAADWPFGTAMIDHVYAAAFNGEARVKVTDTTGQTGEATTPVHIAPHRPLGALQKVEVDGQRVEAADLSADGRFALYQVTDNEGDFQLPTPFGVLDTVTGEHEIVTKMGDGTVVDDPSSARMSDNGEIVVFTRGEWINGLYVEQAYVRNLETDTVVRVTVNKVGAPIAYGGTPIDVADDGNTVLFTSYSEDVTTDPSTNCGTIGATWEPCDQLFVRDLAANTTSLVSTNPDGTPRGGASWFADLTPDGAHVSYFSRDTMVVWDRATGVGEPLDLTLDATPLGWDSGLPSLTPDGRYVLFETSNDKVVTNDTNDDADIFRYNRTTGEAVLVSADKNGGSTDLGSSFPSMSCDGTLVVFWSSATDLVPGDTNGKADLFLRDVTAGTTRRISVEARDGIQADQESTSTSFISGDGSRILYDSEATNLVPGDVNGNRDAFLLDTGLKRSCAPGNEAPTVSIASPAALVEGGSVALQAAVNDPDGDLVTITWSTTGGTLTQDGTAAAQLAAADGPADLTVTVTVSDGTETDTATVPVPVTNAAPSATAGDDVATMVDSAVSFSGTATDPGPVDQAAGLTTSWTFGDGTPAATGPSASHAYTDAGTFTATFSATDKDGATTTDTVVVEVTADEPVTTVPSAPRDVSAVGGDGTANVRWDAPESDGGKPITGYELVVSPGGTTIDTGTERTLAVDGLTNGTDYTFTVRARNDNGYGPSSAASNVTRPRAACVEAIWSDVPDDHPFCPEIKWMGDNGVAKGWPDGTYRPTAPVTRQAMAAFAYRLAGSPDGADPTCDEQPFSDVPTEFVFCGEIAWAKKTGVSGGYADGTYRPNAPVSRQTMAAFLYRLTPGSAGVERACTSDAFTDIGSTHPFCGEIDWLVDNGIAAGYPDSTFRPEDAVSRQAMAAFIFRYDILTGIVG